LQVVEFIKRFFNCGPGWEVEGDVVFISADDLDEIKLQGNQLLRICELNSVTMPLNL
jgi:hypothetical protein